MEKLRAANKETAVIACAPLRSEGMAFAGETVAANVRAVIKPLQPAREFGRFSRGGTLTPVAAMSLLLLRGAIFVVMDKGTFEINSKCVAVVVLSA